MIGDFRVNSKPKTESKQRIPFASTLWKQFQKILLQHCTYGSNWLSTLRNLQWLQYSYTANPWKIKGGQYKTHKKTHLLFCHRMDALQNPHEPNWCTGTFEEGWLSQCATSSKSLWATTPAMLCLPSVRTPALNIFVGQHESPHSLALSCPSVLCNADWHENKTIHRKTNQLHATLDKKRYLNTQDKTSVPLIKPRQ